MVAERDCDKSPLVVIGAFQGNAINGVPDSNDVSTRQGPVLLQVWDPVQKYLVFTEFENFIDYNTLDPNGMGCLVNNGEETKRLQKKYMVLDTVVSFSQALTESASFKQGLLRIPHPPK